jgi:serine O-acetyltransferase
MYKELTQDFTRYSKLKPNLLRIIYRFFATAGFRAVFLYRLGRWFKIKKIGFLAGLCQRLMHHLCHCWISVTAEIGPGFLIAHVGGIIIGGKTIIGSNCDIRQNVTFGGNFKKQDENGRTQPTVGNNVSIAAGACILGPVKVGNFAIVGANSVVTRDVPENMIVSGIPAKVIRERWNENLGRSL